MNIFHVLKPRAPVIAFGLVVVCGWIASLLYDDWLPLCLGLLGGMIAGDVMEAILRASEPPPPKRMDKSR